MEPCERTDIVIVGGGFGGINAALALDRQLKRGLRAEVTFISRSNFFLFTPLLVEVAAELGAYAQRNLESRGIEVWLRARVTAYESGRVRVHEGREINTETLIWTAGMRPSPLIHRIPIPRTEGRDERLPVNDYLQVRGYDTLWAVGDCALVPDAGGRYHPPTAQHAVRQGKHLARNLVASLMGQKLEPFGYVVSVCWRLQGDIEV